MKSIVNGLIFVSFFNNLKQNISHEEIFINFLTKTIF